MKFNFTILNMLSNRIFPDWVYYSIILIHVCPGFLCFTWWNVNLANGVSNGKMYFNVLLLVGLTDYIFRWGKRYKNSDICDGIY